MKAREIVSGEVRRSAKRTAISFYKVRKHKHGLRDWVWA